MPHKPTVERRAFCKAILAGAAVSGGPVIGNLGWGAEFPEGDAPNISAIGTAGGQKLIPSAAIRDLASRLRGRLITPTDVDYNQARRVWNRSFDRRPALIAQCWGVADVIRTLGFAREHDVVLAVRGGGHSYAGYSTCDGGVIIDLTHMRDVRVDPYPKSARVAGGAWNRDLDWEAQQYGLATPMGRVGNTGVGGLTLGGGYGRLSRLYGLACDNVVAADIITADGKLLQVSASEHPDLFWAIRGGGGNFGIVTSFEYRLHPVGPKVFEAALVYSPSQLRSVLEQYVELCPRAPRELQLALSMHSDKSGSRRALLWFFYAGKPEIGERLLASIRAATKPIREGQTTDYLQIQTASDGPSVSDDAEYAKSAHVPAITPELVEALLEQKVDVSLSANGGAISDIAVADSAIAHRREPFQLEVSMTWQDLSESDAKRAEVYAAWERLKGFTSGFYANLTAADQKEIDSNYGPNRFRLEQIKRTFDPSNVFRLNANIRPDAGQGTERSS